MELEEVVLFAFVHQVRDVRAAVEGDLWGRDKRKTAVHACKKNKECGLVFFSGPSCENNGVLLPTSTLGTAVTTPVPIVSVKSKHTT